jgi:hypothetical protein
MRPQPNLDSSSITQEKLWRAQRLLDSTPVREHESVKGLASMVSETLDALVKVKQAANREAQRQQHLHQGQGQRGQGLRAAAAAPQQQADVPTSALPGGPSAWMVGRWN